MYISVCISLNCFGLNFALLGGINEHRALRCGPNSPFTDITSTDGSKFLPYREDAAKNNRGGIKHRTISKAYVNHENPDRCVVTAYEKYISCRHVLYRTTRSTCVLYSFQETHHGKKAVWFSLQAVGREKLAGIVQGICQKEGFDGKRTNQSLRVTALTRMFEETLANN